MRLRDLLGLLLHFGRRRPQPALPREMGDDSLDHLRGQFDRNLGRYHRLALSPAGDFVVGPRRRIGLYSMGGAEVEGILDDEIDAMRDRDIAARMAEVSARLPWTSTLNDARVAVLVELAQDPGGAWRNSFAAMLAALRAMRYAEAARLLAAHPWPTGDLGRAERLATQLRTGLWA